MAIIISPQAGLGNRLRAIAAALWLGTQLKRKVYLLWNPLLIRSPRDLSRYPHVIDLQKRQWSEFFLPTAALDPCPLDAKPSLCLSEWLPGEPWYQEQSCGHRHFACPIRRLDTSVTTLVEQMSSESTILLETSRSDWIDPPQTQITEMYKHHFVPLPRYMCQLPTFSVEIGVAIRRKPDFLSFFPEARQKEEDLRAWIRGIDNRGSPFVFFSDDTSFRKSIQLESKHMFVPSWWNPDSDTEPAPIEAAFLEFLCLSRRCNRIFGTPSSSFAYEAARAGGIPYAIALTEVNTIVPASPAAEKQERPVLIAILAKDKEYCLPLYLKCLEQQTFPKCRTHIWIRTNDNRDGTASLLEKWATRARELGYASVQSDSSSVNVSLKQYKEHEWNSLRFSILGKIRQESINKARQLGAHYFVVDCDNFIRPPVLQTLLETGKSVIGPMLTHPGSSYSNFHNICDRRGYFQANSLYVPILHRIRKGILPVDVIHCTYLVRYETLDRIAYQDDTKDYEYVIFSRNLRRQNIQQYMDNREDYGWLTLCQDTKVFEEEMVQHSRLSEFSDRSVPHGTKQDLPIKTKMPHVKRQDKKSTKRNDILSVCTSC